MLRCRRCCAWQLRFPRLPSGRAVTLLPSTGPGWPHHLISWVVRATCCPDARSAQEAIDPLGQAAEPLPVAFGDPDNKVVRATQMPRSLLRGSLIRSYAACQPAQGGLQNHPGLGQHQGGMVLRCCAEQFSYGDVARQGRRLPCKQCHARALPAISSAAHGSNFPWELSRLADNLAAWEAARWTAAGCPKGEVSRERDSSINRPSQNLPEGDTWSITTNSHHLPTQRHGFRNRSRRGARLSTVSLTSASLVGAVQRTAVFFKLSAKQYYCPPQERGTR
jgi:hypothetical protein